MVSLSSGKVSFLCFIITLTFRIFLSGRVSPSVQLSSLLQEKRGVIMVASQSFFTNLLNYFAGLWTPRCQYLASQDRIRSTSATPSPLVYHSCCQNRSKDGCATILFKISGLCLKRDGQQSLSLDRSCACESILHAGGSIPALLDVTNIELLNLESTIWGRPQSLCVVLHEVEMKREAIRLEVERHRLVANNARQAVDFILNKRAETTEIPAP
uniref:Phlebovirus glycoprotein G2 fusion domain-containing protein n=1 Tax=Heterorhabditis bacteriophora TaxID=37862 RepID=A0A1I7WGE6_HETBA